MLCREICEARLISDRDGRLLGEYAASGATVFAEYIWLLPEVSDGAGRVSHAKVRRTAPFAVPLLNNI